MKKINFLQLLSKAIFALCICLFYQQTHATNLGFDMNENCKNAYNKIISLELKNAESLIALEKKEHPNNAATAYLEHAKDFILFFVEEKEPDFISLDNLFEQRLRQIEQIDDKSPFKKYLLAQMNLEMCIANGKMGNFITAFLEVRKANNLLRDNQKKFPTNMKKKNYKSR